MNWPMHLRTIAVAVGAFTLCCGLVTQMLARALGYAPELGPALIDMGGVRLYTPFSFLGWTLAWAPIAPSLFVLALCLALVCALAAYAAAIVVARLEPIALADSSPWRDLAAWREIGHYGLLRDGGLALGAVRRHALAKHQIVRSDADTCVFLGKPEHTDDAFLAALASWRGTLVLVDARGRRLAERLGRDGVLRFAPGRNDTLCINPLLAIRGGLHAWNDARRLAGALLVNGDAAPSAIVDAFALLMLDQLLCAPVEARTLAALRRRLIDPTALVAELCSRWTAQPSAEAAPAIWEMVRVARAQRSEPDHALADFARIDEALAVFAGAGLAHATGAHHLNLAEFVAAPTPQTLVLSMEIAGAGAAPLIHALLAQLAVHHASASNAPALMVAVEADAAQCLVEQLGAELPIGPNTRALLQTANIAHAERLTGTGSVVAIGPQNETSARSLSERAGRCVVFGPLPHAIPRRWRSLLFPAWVKQEMERLPAEALRAVAPTEAFLIGRDQRPVRMQVLIGAGASRFTSVSAPARHDWSAPPLEPSPPLQAPAAGAVVHTGPRVMKLRRVLTRAAAKPANTGARAK